MADSNNRVGFSIYIDDKGGDKTLKSLAAEAKKLRNEIAGLTPGTQAFISKMKEMEGINSSMAKINSQLKSTGFSFGNLAENVNKYWLAASTFVAGIAGIGFTFTKMLQGAAQLSDQLADIRKTTGMTQEQVESLNQSFKNIDTRTAREDLRSMAVVAGQLGIATKDVFAFVEATDKLNVALGDEFGGNAEEIAKQMGTLRNVLGDMKTADIGGDMLKIGNAINELGAAGFATGPVITDFANRIGGIGISLGLTSGQVLGMSATMQELNINVERGGTAVGRILMKMTTNIKDFAKVANMPVKDFSELVNKDLFGAFEKVIEGSKKGGDSTTALAEIIKDLGVDGAGASEVFLKLGNNVGMLDEKVKLASDSLKNSDSITSEFNIKNQTLGSTIDKLKKEFYNLTQVKGLQDFLKGTVNAAVKLVDAFKNMGQIIKDNRTSIILMTGALVLYNASLIKSIYLATTAKIASLAEIALTKLKVFWTNAQITATAAYITITNLATGSITFATAATRLWNLAMAASPLGPVIIAVTALAAGISVLTKNTERQTQQQRMLNDIELEAQKSISEQKVTMDQLWKTATNNNLSLEKRKKAIAEINEISPRYLGDLTLETINTNAAKQAKEAYIESLLKEAQIKGAKDKLSELYKQQFDAVDPEKVKWYQKAIATITSGGEAMKTSFAVGNSIKELENINKQIKAVEKTIEVAEKPGKNANLFDMKDKTRAMMVHLESLKKYNKDQATILKEGNNADPDDPKKGKANKTIENYIKMRDAINKLKDEQYLKEKSDYDKEAAAIDNKYEELFIAAKGNNTATKELEELHLQDILNLQEKYKNKEKDQYQKDVEAGQALIQKTDEDNFAKSVYSLQRQEQLELLQAENSIKNTKELEKKKLEIQLKYLEAKLALLKNSNEGIGEEEKKNIAILEETIKGIKNTLANTTTDKKGIDKLLAEQLGLSDKGIENVKKAAQTVEKILKDLETVQINKINAQQSREDQRYENERLNIEKSLGTTKDKQAKLEKLEREHKQKEYQLELKAWKTKRDWALGQAIVYGALAAITQLAEESWVGMGLAIAAAAADIVVIESEQPPSPPSYVVGGKTGKGFYRDATGKRVAGVVHENEYVIPEWERSIPVVAQMEQTIEAIRTNKQGYAAGGHVSSSSTTNYYADNETKKLLKAVLKQFSSPVKAELRLQQKDILDLTKVQDDLAANKQDGMM